MKWAQGQKGFTIVELLIVIVVIAILAAISVVAYNGIQNRAKNQQTISAVTVYYKALSAYSVDESALPVARACLGEQNFYTSNPCYIGASTYTWSSALNSALNPYINAPATTASGAGTNGAGITASGIFYDNAAGGATGYIGFVQFGASSCPTVAGAPSYGPDVLLDADVYCRIKVPAY